MALSNKDYLKVAKAFIEVWVKATLKELNEDIENCEKLEILEQAFNRAYWSKHIDELFTLSKKPESFEEKYELFYEVFDEQFDFPANLLKPDIKDRFEKLKNNLVADFEKEIKKLINTKKIISPIEQIFLMEWKFYRIEEKNKIKLIPQESVKTDKGIFRIDFLIVPEDRSKNNFKVAIELDGHEFHEKSKKQVEYDKKRERAIVKSGFTVLRFSGSEIFRNCKSCIDEIENYVITL
ncbi:MAG: DUF559 domain-containing protein [Ignavibacteria bacterium]|jgi:very-short-patch-repair endonuclease